MSFYPHVYFSVSHTFIYSWPSATISTFSATSWFSVFGAVHPVLTQDRSPVSESHDVIYTVDGTVLFSPLIKTNEEEKYWLDQNLPLPGWLASLSRSIPREVLTLWNKLWTIVFEHHNPRETTRSTVRIWAIQSNDAWKVKKSSAIKLFYPRSKGDVSRLSTGRTTVDLFWVSKHHWSAF